MERRNIYDLNFRAWFEGAFPGFFDSMSEEEDGSWFCEEMAIDLSAAPSKEAFSCPAGIRFGRCCGDGEALHAAVRSVDPAWERYYDRDTDAYCAFDGGRVVSFCIVDDFGTIGGYRIGGPGCVGTVPEYRKRGIGRRLVAGAGEILLEKGFEISYIHYTGVGPWYGKMGYQTVLRWNSRGFLD